MENTFPLAGSDSEILALATPIFDIILAAHDEGDYAKLADLLSGEMQDALTEEVFSALILNHLAGLGDLAGSDYLGCLNKGDATQLLWKARYSASHAEILWQLFLARRGEGIEVVGLLFS